VSLTDILLLSVTVSSLSKDLSVFYRRCHGKQVMHCDINVNSFVKRQHLFDIAAIPIGVDSNILPADRVSVG